jgi:hypothetical protein
MKTNNRRSFQVRPRNDTSPPHPPVKEDRPTLHPAAVRARRSKAINPTMFAWCTASVCCLCPAVGAVPEARFQAEGDLSYVVRDGQKVVAEHTRQFSVAVAGCKWIIRIWDSTGTSTNGILYSQAGFDGTNIYRVTAFEVSTAESAVASSAAAKRYTNEVDGRLLTIRNNAAAVVIPGNFPVPSRMDPFIIPVWLAYASGCSFEESRNGLLRPVYALDRSLDVSTYRVKADWRTLGAQTGVPAWVAYFNDGRTVTRPDGQVGAADPPYDQGFTNAVYEALTLTNLGGLGIPLSFRLTTFSAKPGGRTPGELLAVAEFTASARIVRPASGGDSFVPPLPANTFVTDARAQTGGVGTGYVYFSSNGAWLDQSAVAKLAAGTAVHATPSQGARLAVLGLLAASALVFATLAFKRRVKRSGSARDRDGAWR